MLLGHLSSAVDRTVLSIGGAIFSALVVRSLSARWAELGSEALCWAILPLLFLVKRRRNCSQGLGASLSALPSAFPPPRPRPRKSWIGAWLPALAIAMAALYQAELGPNKLLPAAAPLLLVSSSYLRPNSNTLNKEGQRSAHTSSTAWGSAALAVASIVILCDGNIGVSVALSLVPTGFIILVYLCLNLDGITLDWVPPKSSTAVSADRAHIPLPPAALLSTALVLGLQTTKYGLPSIQGILLGWKHMLVLGSFKASMWYFSSQAAQSSSWGVVLAALTFAALSNADLFRHLSEINAIIELMVCLVSLAQVIAFVPKNTRGRCLLWGYSALPLVLYLSQAYRIRSLASGVIQTFVHPAERLIESAREDFRHLTEMQSRSYTVAHAEYKRRYGMEPPTGFEDWYAYAMDNNSPMIDDFDVLHTSLAPFFRLTGQEFLQALEDVQRNPDTDVWLCRLNKEQKTIACSHPSRTFDRNVALMFDAVLQNLTVPLPDVSFLVNHLDEPRVVASGTEEGVVRTTFVETNLGHRPAFSTITKLCANDSLRTAPGQPTSGTRGFLFVTSLKSSMDLCQNPIYASQHGLFLSPTSLRLIEGLVPILSTGAPSTMGDILYPSPAYTVEDEFAYDAAHDVAWEDKRNNLYWAGSTTGGYAGEKTPWKSFHRQRFVALAQGRWDIYQYLREEEGVMQRVGSRFLNKRLFDVDFTRIFMCAVRECRDEKDYFRTKGWVNKDAALGSRLVFDIDGNGISGRYYKLLASKSAVLKQTIFREWHDDRLVPWVHYIPVSLGMEELPELVLWLTSTKLGQMRARDIADQGREWMERALRPVDRGIYLYRMLLELARLQDPEREALR